MTPAEQAVIEAAQAWVMWRGDSWALPGCVERNLIDAVAALAASAPDEVNEAQT